MPDTSTPAQDTAYNYAYLDEYRIVVHPVISGRGPTLFHGLSSARQLELLSTQRFKSGGAFRLAGVFRTGSAQGQATARVTLVEVLLRTA